MCDMMIMFAITYSDPLVNAGLKIVQIVNNGTFSESTMKQRVADLQPPDGNVCTNLEQTPFFL